MNRTITAAIAAAIMTLVPNMASAQMPPPMGVLEGNPKSDHRLTIISAFSCVYCRAFDTQAMEELRSVWIGKGLQVETIPVSISPTDIPASIAATCGDPKKYARRSTILFRSQSAIAGNWRGADEETRRKVEAMPKGASAPEIAKLSGISDMASSLGLTNRQLSECIGDPVRQARQIKREKLTDEKWHIVGTPTVFLDGKKIGSTWEDVRKALQKTYS